MRTVMYGIIAALSAAMGTAATFLFLSPARPIGAASNDRYGDYIIATGAVAVNPRIPTDGVWLLDYKAGKLLGTVIDRNSGKIIGWAEVDLTAEFGLARNADVHFMMTTGYITQNQSALYLAETTSGLFGVYTMGPGPNGVGIVIRRHDLTRFREVAAGGPAGGAIPNPAAGGPGGGAAGPGIPPAIGPGIGPGNGPAVGATAGPPGGLPNPARLPNPTGLPNPAGLPNPGIPPGVKPAQLPQLPQLPPTPQNPSTLPQLSPTPQNPQSQTPPAGSGGVQLPQLPGVPPPQR